MRTILVMLTVLTAASGLAIVALADGNSGNVVTLTPADVLNAKGDGPDGKGNTADDTWQFWFELAHKPGSFHRLDIHTTTLSQGRRKGGIKGKVTGPIAARMPNPNDTEGWIYHSDWDGRFEGAWADKKTDTVLLYPYVEKNYHGCVALSYRVKQGGTYTVAGTITDAKVVKHKLHDGFTWRIEVRKSADKKGTVVGKAAKSIGDKIGPDAETFEIKNVKVAAGQMIFVVIDPGKWWGSDMAALKPLTFTRTGE